MKNLTKTSNMNNFELNRDLKKGLGLRLVAEAVFCEVLIRNSSFLDVVGSQLGHSFGNHFLTHK